MAAQARPAVELQTDRAARHHAAVGRTLVWAEDAATRGDYAEALAWIETLEALGDELASEYQAKREAWRAMAKGRVAHESRMPHHSKDATPPSRDPKRGGLTR